MKGVTSPGFAGVSGNAGVVRGTFLTRVEAASRREFGERSCELASPSSDLENPDDVIPAKAGRFMAATVVVRRYPWTGNGFPAFTGMTE